VQGGDDIDGALLGFAAVAVNDVRYGRADQRLQVELRRSSEELLEALVCELTRDAEPEDAPPTEAPRRLGREVARSALIGSLLGLAGVLGLAIIQLVQTRP
jgi:hypothetical protein